MNDQIQSYVFASSNGPSLVASASLESLETECDEFFAVVLAGDDELALLMSLLGVEPLTKTSLSPGADFSALFDYSGNLLPQLSGENFDAFYEEWLRKSGRESNMDEYGQLIFLQGRAANWNSKPSRFILREKA
jgi:hypothetical protein